MLRGNIRKTKITISNDQDPNENHDFKWQENPKITAIEYEYV